MIYLRNKNCHLQLSIIIVNYSVKYFLEQCLYSVEKACGNIAAEIFVVDNASTDDSRHYFQGRFPEIQFIWLEKNIGFAKANNAALARTKGTYVLFLNPDTIVAEDSFQICLSFAERQAQFGSLGVKMIDGSGNYLRESKRMFPTLSASFYKMAGLTKVFPHSAYFSRYYAAHVHEDASSEVEVLAGAFMMVSKKVLDITQGFDEDFFMYGEDIDLSYRITTAGYKNFYCGKTSIIHFKGESVQKESRSYLKNFYGAMLLFVKKHGKTKKPGVKAAILAAYGLASLKQSLPVSGNGHGSRKKNAMAIVAGQEVFNKVLHIIKLSIIPFLITGRVAIDLIDKDNTIGQLDNLKSILSNSRITQLVLAEGQLSFKRIIEIMRSNKNRVDFLIHANNSKSIVGSSDKNTSGFYVADSR